MSHRLTESKSKSKKKKNKVNKSIDDLDKNAKNKNKSKNRLLKLLKSKTPPKYNSNYMSLNNKIFNEISKSDIPTSVKNKKVHNKDKITYNQSIQEEKKLINMKEFANFLNNYVNYHNKPELKMNKLNNNKNISKEKLNSKRNNNKDKSKSKEKTKPNKIYHHKNFSNYYENIGTNIDTNGIIHQQFFNNASINIYNNINNIQINNINNLNLKENNKKEIHKTNSHKFIIYNQKRNISNQNNIIINNNQNKSNRSKDRKKIDFVYKRSKNTNIFDELKKQRKILKNKILNILGEEDYKYIIELYEKTYEEEDKAQDYFEHIEQYVKLKFDSNKKEKFENYFEQLMSIDCHLNIQ